MRIEEVDVIERILRCNDIAGIQFWAPAVVEMLRAEAWHPIEKAEELGAKDGMEVLAIRKSGYFCIASWDGECWATLGYRDYTDENLSHFRFINPPEN